MHATFSLRYFVLLLLCSFPLVAVAGNFSFLKDSLISQLSGNDMEQLKAEIVKVLEDSPDKKISHWQASDSHIKVKILPKLSYSEAGLPCRRTLLNFSLPERSAESYGFTICKNVENKWQVTQSSLQKLSAKDLELVESHALQALDANQIGTPITWFNPNSKINGTVVLIGLAQKNQKPCKTLAISLFDPEGVSLEGQYLLCRKGDGWVREGF